MIAEVLGGEGILGSEEFLGEWAIAHNHPYSLHQCFFKDFLETAKLNA